MAKIQLTNGDGFQLIPEGKTTFKIDEVDESKYEDFGKLKVVMVTENGKKHSHNFSFIKANGDTNEGALSAWSLFAKKCLKNFDIDEIDTQDIVGCYITADVEHETYTRRDGGEGKAERLRNLTEASGFDTADSNDDDLDSFLDD